MPDNTHMKVCRNTRFVSLENSFAAPYSSLCCPTEFYQQNIFIVAAACVLSQPKTEHFWSYFAGHTKP